VSAIWQSVRAEDTGADVLKKIQGTWRFVSHEMDGKPAPKDEVAKQTITFAGDKWTVRGDGKVIQAGTHHFDPAKKPAQLDAVAITPWAAPARGLQLLVPWFAEPVPQLSDQLAERPG
jgi:uncharacterized protein (TIGR03067 family)